MPNIEFAHVPFLFMLGKIVDEAVVVDDRVEIQKTMTITATVDHRYADGATLAQMASTFKQIMSNPQTELADYV